MYMKSYLSTNAFSTVPLRYDSTLEAFETICEWSPPFINCSCSSEEVEIDQDKPFSSSKVCTIDGSQFSHSQTKAGCLIEKSEIETNTWSIKQSESPTDSDSGKFKSRTKFQTDKPSIPETDCLKRRIKDQLPIKKNPSEAQQLQILDDRPSLNTRFYTKIESTTSLQIALSENSSDPIACGDRDNDSVDPSLEMKLGIRIPAWKASSESTTCWLANSVCHQPPVVKFNTSRISLTKDSSKNYRSAQCNRTGVRFYDYFRKLGQIADSDKSFCKSFEDSREKVFIPASEQYKMIEVLHYQLGKALSPTVMTAKASLAYDATILRYCCAQNVEVRAPLIARKGPIQHGTIKFHGTSVTQHSEWFDLVHLTSNSVDDSEIPTNGHEQGRLLESEFISPVSTNATKSQGDQSHSVGVFVEFESYFAKPVTETSNKNSTFSLLHEKMGSGTGSPKLLVHGMAFELSTYDSDDSLQTETECKILTSLVNSVKNASSENGSKMVCKKIMGVYRNSSNLVSDDTTADIETIKIFQSQDLDECVYASESAVLPDTEFTTLVLCTEIVRTAESQPLSTPAKDQCSVTNSSSQSNRLRYRLTHRCHRKESKPYFSRNGLLRNRVEIKCQYWTPSSILDR